MQTKVVLHKQTLEGFLENPVVVLVPFIRVTGAELDPNPAKVLS